MRHEMTPAERKLWECLHGSRLGGFHFRRQQILGYYFADFYCHQAALVVEIDGGIHQEQQEYDREREQGLQAIGLRVIHFSNPEVFQDINRVLAEILKACNINTEKNQPQDRKG
jgi:very-short-patch-repair endonuclease